MAAATTIERGEGFGQEATMAEFSTSIVRKDASGNGDIAGLQITCTCGLVWATSLGMATAQAEGAAHLRWHADKLRRAQERTQLVERTRSNNERARRQRVADKLGVIS